MSTNDCWGHCYFTADGKIYIGREVPEPWVFRCWTDDGPDHPYVRGPQPSSVEIQFSKEATPDAVRALLAKRHGGLQIDHKYNNAHYKVRELKGQITTAFDSLEDMLAKKEVHRSVPKG